jgi:hypothetical protein
MGDMSGEWEEYEDIILDDDSVSTGVLTVAACRLHHPSCGWRVRGTLLKQYWLCCRSQSLSVLENVDEAGFVLAKIEGATPPASRQLLARLQSPSHALISSYTHCRARIVTPLPTTVATVWTSGALLSLRLNDAVLRSSAASKRPTS